MRWTKVAAVATLAASAAITAVAQPPAGATPDATLERLAGADRIDTAIEISRATWSDDEAGAVVLARHDRFPDALAGGPLAVAKDAPVLVNPVSALDPRVATELHRVLPANGTVYLLGGTAALSAGVEQQVRSAGYQVERYGGQDRFETAVAVNRDGLRSPAMAFVADGTSFADALIAAAAAGSRRAGVVLTNGSSMPAVSGEYLTTVVDHLAVGAPAAAATPGAPSIVGADAYDTSQRVAGQLFEGAGHVALASGVAFPDALAGGAHIARFGGPLLLTAPDALPGSVGTYLQGAASAVEQITVYGGTAAVHESVAQAALGAVGFDPSHHVVQPLYVVPDDGPVGAVASNGTLQRSIDAMQGWLSDQTGGSTLRMAGGPIPTVRLAAEGAELAAAGIHLRDRIEEELAAAGHDRPGTVYAVWYDGPNDSGSCGGGAWPPHLVDQVAALYLQGDGGGVPCGAEFSPDGQQMRYRDYSMLHEVFHTLGFVAECAPNHTRSGHTSDSPTDLMYAGDQPWDPQVLDVGNDDYFDTPDSSCPDLADSVFLVPTPDGAELPPDW